MAHNVIVPRESEEMESCQIMAWFVKKGERVEAGAPLCEVDTGKATFDIEAPADGVILDILYAEGTEAPLLTPIAVIGEQGEEYDTRKPDEYKPPEPVKADRDQVEVLSQDSTGQEEMPETRDEKRPVRPFGEKSRVSGRDNEYLASPRARRLAVRNGVNLQQLEGSGPGGAVIERDVTRYLHSL
jgi:pyruvate dehydrogenase E2 component (dihydrolipoamide acetyltransferase)